MSPIKRVSVLVILLGCGSSNHHDITLIDASVDTAAIDSPTGGTNEVELQVLGQETPDLIVYRDANGSWLAPESLGNGRYTLHVTNAYEVVAVCTITGATAGYDAEELAATIDDARPYMFCGRGSSPPRVAVTGTMTQAGTVLMSDTATSTTGPWSFALQVPTGTHDLVALAGQRMLLQRGISITGPTTLPAVDVAASGTAMSSVTLAISGTTTDPVETKLELLTAHDDATVSDTTNNTVALPPAALLQSTDFTFLTIDAPDQAHLTDRMISVFGFDGSTTELTLPDPVSGIAYTTSNGTLDATWGPLPTHTSLDLLVFGGSAAASAQQHVMATTNWVKATAATSVAFDTSAPGYVAGWKPDLTRPYLRSFSVSDDEDAAYFFSEVHENVNGAIARRPPARPRSLLVRQASLGRR